MLERANSDRGCIDDIPLAGVAVAASISGQLANKLDEPKLVRFYVLANF